MRGWGVVDRRRGGSACGWVSSRAMGERLEGTGAGGEGDRLVAKEAEEGPGPGGAGGDAEGRAWTHADGFGGRKVTECLGAGGGAATCPSAGDRLLPLPRQHLGCGFICATI